MALRPFTTDDLPELMSWFSSETEILLWAGPDFRFPFDQASFLHDLKCTEVASYVLAADDGTLLGFGQFSLQYDCCHLSRLVINPNARGQSLIQILLLELCRKGQKALTVTTVSLFVFNSNTPAIKAYLNAGFWHTTHPTLQHPLFSYMQKHQSA